VVRQELRVRQEQVGLQVLQELLAQVVHQEHQVRQEQAVRQELVEQVVLRELVVRQVQVV
jgi:hypothetical protein